MPPPVRQQETHSTGDQKVFIDPHAGTFQVAAFGDSLMWGQGLEREHRFSVLFTEQLQPIVGMPGKLVWDQSRSGAKIRDLPGERQAFADTHPDLFADTRTRRAFLDGRSDAPAAKLYGEVPATFPTVLGQVDMLSAAAGRRIQVALVDGGINDIAVEDVVNPLVATGRYIERFDGEIRRIVDDNVTSLLTAVRAKCPNAVIMYFGFFPTISYRSDTGKLRALFKHEYDDDFKWWFNRYVYEVIDVNEMINEAMTRGLWFQGRWQYWTRKAVNYMASDDARRGPGVLFVPSGFASHHAGFASSSRLWEDYTYPVQDPARFERTRHIPREPQVGLMRDTAALIAADAVANRAQVVASVRKLDAAITAPPLLKRDLQDYLDRRSGSKDAVLDSLGDEIHRIQRALIASMAHPNRQGALAGYSVQALERFREHRTTMAAVRKELRDLGRPAAAGVPGPPLTALLTRCNLRGRGSLAGAVTNLFVDSIALIITTATHSSRNMGLSADLVVSMDLHAPGGRPTPFTFRLTFINHVDAYDVIAEDDTDPIGKPYPYLEPGQTNRLTVDTGEGLELGRIRGCSIVMGPDPWADASDSIRRRYGRRWSPDTVAIEINGTRVHTAELLGTTLGPGQHVDLGWPAPDPGLQPPVVVMTKLRRVRGLGELAPDPRLSGRRAP